MLLAAIALLVVELVKGVDDTAAPLGLQVQVDHGSADVAMTQKFFYGVQVCTCIKQVCGEGMAKGVSTKTFVLKSCLLHSQLHIELNAAGMHCLALFCSFK